MVAHGNSSWPDWKRKGHDRSTAVEPFEPVAVLLNELNIVVAELSRM